MDKGKQYNATIDLLRIIAILAVVLIHTTTKTVAVSHFDFNHVNFALFLNQTARFAVPLFFMISGFVLELNYSFHSDFLAYIKKRLGRIFIPYVFWSFIYFFIIYPKSQNPGGILMALINGTASYQLYFIPSLLIFYLIFPLINKYYSRFSNWKTMLILGSFEVLLLFYEYFVGPLPIFMPIKIALLNYFVFLLGVVSSHNIEKIMGFMKKWKFLIYFLALVFGLSVFSESKALYLKTHNYLAIYSQWRPTIMIYTIFLAVSLYYLLKDRIKNVRLVKLFSGLSFFVFFFHVIVLEAIWQNIGAFLFKATNGQVFNNIFYDPLFFFCVVAISFSVAYIVHKIPYLKNLTG